MSGSEFIRSTPASSEETKWKRWFLNPYLTIVISIFLDAAAQTMLKIGADRSVAASAVLGISGLKSGWVWLGMTAMVVSLGFWIYSLRFVRLSIASNLTGSVHVLVPLSCWFFLGERISMCRWTGILLVIAGVFVIAKPLMRVEEKMEERL